MHNSILGIDADVGVVYDHIKSLGLLGLHWIGRRDTLGPMLPLQIQTLYIAGISFMVLVLGGLIVNGTCMCIPLLFLRTRTFYLDIIQINGK